MLSKSENISQPHRIEISESIVLEFDDRQGVVGFSIRVLIQKVRPIPFTKNSFIKQSTVGISKFAIQNYNSLCDCS